MNYEEKISDEIDLMDYLKVILKRKRVILGFCFGLAVLVGILSYLMPKVYKIDTLLEVGRVGGEPLEAPWQVVEKIDNDVYGIQIREKIKISEEEYPKIKTENPKDTNLVLVEIESSDPQKSKNILKELNELILKEHQAEIEIKKELLEKDIERLKSKTASLEEEKKNLEAKVEALEKVLLYQQTPGSQFALFDTKEKLEKKKQEIEDLYFQINSLERFLEDIQPTKIAKIPTISEKPVKPRPLLNIVIAGVLGSFIGTLWVFLREWWEKNKARI